MKVSVWPTNGRSWEETNRVARTAEAQGWHGFWYPDHLMPNKNDNDGSPADGPALECWSVLSGIASITSRIRLGSLVSPVTFHHPVVLAKRAMAVDEISNGRVTLGLGAGWQINEHRCTGIELPRVGERVGRFEEAIEIISRMRHEQRVTFTGSRFTVTDLPANPKPLQQPLPIVVGTAGARMARATARWADEWNTWGDVAAVRDKTTVFNRECEAVGRDPASVRRSAQAMIFFVDDAHAAEDTRRRAPKRRSLVGNSEFVLGEVAKLAELGVDEFIMPDFNLNDSEVQRAEAFDRFWTEVATKL